MIQFMAAAKKVKRLPYYEKLKTLIKKRTARIAIVGLGYVGLPEAVEFAQAGFIVTGIDLSSDKVAKLSQAISYIQDVTTEQLREVVDAGRLRATTDFSCISEMDTITICVPTPLTRSKEPDMSYIISAMDQIKKYLRPGQLVILESTTYPGTTEELLLPEFTRLNLKIGEDLFLAFSPERVDPGNARFHTQNIPKVVGGVTTRCTELATMLYQRAVEAVVPVSSPSIAEMAKLLENTFRSVNIGLANEFAMMCRVLKLNVWEVIKAASTKPFGFMPFYPGPGVGGHCIPLDPYYLSWKARMLGFESRFIDLAGQVNAQMPAYTVSLTMEALNDHNKCLRDAHIHIMGVAYKPDINDVRESPALEVIQLLLAKGAVVTYSDPYVPKILIGDQIRESVEPTRALLESCDCVLILANHSNFDYQALAEYAPLIIDTRNAMANLNTPNLVRL